MFKIRRKKQKHQRRPVQGNYTMHDINILEIHNESNALTCPATTMVMPTIRELKTSSSMPLGKQQQQQQQQQLNVCNLIKPYEPMLAKAPNTFDNIDYSQFLYEEKYDGERMLAIVHQDYILNQYYTRTLKLCNIFAHVIELKPGIKQCIVDGEIVYMTGPNKTIIPICDANHRNALHTEYRIFDIQSLDGVSVRHKTLLERKTLLTLAIVESSNVKLSEWHLCENRNVVNSAFDAITANIKGEGLMLKHIDGIYKPGVRDWLKMKAINILKNRCEYDLFIHRLMPDKNGVLNVLDCGYYTEREEYVHVVYVSGGINNDLRAKLKLLSDENTHQLNCRQIVTIHADRRVTNKKSLRHPVVHRLRYDINAIDLTPFLN